MTATSPQPNGFRPVHIFLWGLIIGLILSQFLWAAAAIIIMIALADMTLWAIAFFELVKERKKSRSASRRKKEYDEGKMGNYH